MTLLDLIQKADTTHVVDTLTALHRIHYYEPGYVLSDKVSDTYHSILNKLKSTTMPQSSITDLHVTYNPKSETYDLYITHNGHKTPLREWWNWDKPINSLQYINIKYKKLNLEELLAEVLVEITFYLFPEEKNIKLDV